MLTIVITFVIIMIMITILVPRFFALVTESESKFR